MTAPNATDIIAVIGTVLGVFTSIFSCGCGKAGTLNGLHNTDHHVGGLTIANRFKPTTKKSITVVAQ
jgi:hypothetical protein